MEIKQNYIDRVISYVSPAKGAQRMASRRALEALQGGEKTPADISALGYDGATDNRKRKAQAWARSTPTTEENILSRTDRTRLTLETSDLRRNYGIAFGFLNRFADFVVGTGLQPQAKTTSKDWNQISENFFNQWGKVADYRQRCELWQLERLAVKFLFLEGEAFFALLDNGQIQPIEPSRIATPNNMAEDADVIQGVRVGAGGIVQGFYVCDRGDNGSINLDSYSYVLRENMVHVYDPERFDQVRGIPALASVVNLLRDKADFSESTLLKARLDAYKAWAIYTDKNIGPNNLQARDANPTASGATGEIKLESTDAGEMWYLPANSKIDSLASKTPNNVYCEFNESIIDEIAAALGMPKNILMLKAPTRAEIVVARKTIARIEKVITAKMLSRLWNWRIAKAIKAGDLPAAPLDAQGTSQWFNCEWMPSGIEPIDRADAAQADVSDYNLSTKSLSEICKARGVEFEDVLAAKAREIEQAILTAQEINKRNGTNLNWRELIVSGNPGQFNNEQIKQQMSNPPTGGK